jgi:hypothetical protein
MNYPKVVKTIGLIPASGKATRINGLPKFALPISDDSSLLRWHVEKMIEVCDEVRVSTQDKWYGLIADMNLPITIVRKEPSTLSDAILSLADRGQERMIFSMPDTFFTTSRKNPYQGMFDRDGDIILGVFNCPKNLRGKVGQVQVKDSVVINAVDKVSDCDFEYMWGFMGFREGFINRIDPISNTPSTEIVNWIKVGNKVEAFQIDGDYIDVGSFEGVKQLYASI